MIFEYNSISLNHYHDEITLSIRDMQSGTDIFVKSGIVVSWVQSGEVFPRTWLSTHSVCPPRVCCQLVAVPELF